MLIYHIGEDSYDVNVSYIEIPDARCKCPARHADQRSGSRTNNFGLGCGYLSRFLTVYCGEFLIFRIPIVLILTVEQFFILPYLNGQRK